MARHSSSRILCSEIQRSFVPSRLERQLLTFAFEQALPVVRRQLPRASQHNTLISTTIKYHTYRYVSGGCS